VLCPFVTICHLNRSSVFVECTTTTPFHSSTLSIFYSESCFADEDVGVLKISPNGVP